MKFFTRRPEEPEKIFASRLRRKLIFPSAAASFKIQTMMDTNDASSSYSKTH